MINKIKFKTKLLIPMGVLISMILLLMINLIFIQYAKTQSLFDIKDSIKLATNISKFIHSTQKERGITSGFLASKGIKFKDELLKQRIVTDRNLEILKKQMLDVDNEHILKVLQKALLSASSIQSVRMKVDKLNFSIDKNIKFYSQINENFLNVIIEILKISKLPMITQNIMAYINFLYAKENAGIERAIGTAILTKDVYDKNLHVAFITLIAIEKLYIKTFFKYASDDAKKYYEKIYRGKDIDEVRRIRKIILFSSHDEMKSIGAKYWFKEITSKINKLEYIDIYLAKEILSNIDSELSNTYKLFFIFSILVLISIAIFISIMLLFTKLLKSKERLKQLIDKYIISSTTDLKGKITDVSDAFCNISGYSREELIGKPHNIIRHPDMPKKAFKELWDTIQSGKAWDGEIKNLKKDGGYYWVYAHVEPLFDTKGNIEAYAAVRLDITDSIHLEEELKRSKEKDKTLLHQSKLAQMGEMISMIAHQWRQPLTAISSTASDLYMKIMLDNYTKDYFNKKLEKIDDLSQHLSSTIDDFRNFYKEDKQKEIVVHSEIALGAFKIISTSLEYKNIALKSDFQCKRKINILVNELRQVVLNLIKNAEDILIEKSITNPYIMVRTYDDGKYSYLEVSDNGGGIEENIIDNIFDPYFSTKTKKDGTGLGLYMSKMIVEEHCGGELLVSNTQDGAKFTIKIPTMEVNEDV
jgi:PAS domain S-box-containing protein